ncbi:MAG: hypothetical protein BGO89_02330 [Candidatus Kapaibacterium thiocyanatum]|uniref:Uncharacterized protein n=1 Tax=Candidatus Kapaibacterium thiocyanatum TaxID=1895771 RepID=A0A1M3L2C6_9BACT|nr:MAG: hypothetical protein BGO89_02330 ['Candidatus Kapabacteria' thiocyanatum]
MAPREHGTEPETQCHPVQNVDIPPENPGQIDDQDIDEQGDAQDGKKGASDTFHATSYDTVSDRDATIQPVDNFSP